MKQTIEINVPDGYEAKWNEETKQIDLIKKSYPKSWEEYCTSTKVYEYMKYTPKQSDSVRFLLGGDVDNIGAFIALAQLVQLRKAWVGDWGIRWCDGNQAKFCICLDSGELTVFTNFYKRRSLSFPTLKMANEFLNTFHDLIVKARTLI